MMRLIFFCAGIICLTLFSCNDDGVNTEYVAPNQEKQLRELAIQYPDSLLIQEKLIQYYRELDDYSHAIQATDYALKNDSLNARLHDIKATLYFEDGDTLNAIKSFETAVDIDPRPEYVISLGSLYAQTKNPMALAMADALLQAPAAKAQQQAIFIKGIYYSYIGEKVKAIIYFDKCLQLDYRDLLSYREKAICLYDLNKYATALDVLKKAITVQKTFDEGYYWMGRCYEKLGNKKEAIENYQLALQFDPDYVEAKEVLSKIQ